MGYYEERARELHRNKYNCAQAVAVAFADVAGMDEATALKASSGFGGGFGKLHETCGAVSGMIMAAGLIYGIDHIDDDVKNKVDYPRVRELVEKFKEINGSVVCKELLGVDGCTRTREANKTCNDMVGDAAKILEEYIAEHPVTKE